MMQQDRGRCRQYEVFGRKEIGDNDPEHVAQGAASLSCTAISIVDQTGSMRTPLCTAV